MEKRYLYFAYGSNLNLAQMYMRCPDSEVVGPGTLYGYKLMFRQHLDVEKDHRYQVEGTLFSVSEKDLEYLDRYEGVPRYYTREQVVISNYTEDLIAFVYIMRNQHHTSPPSVGYWDIVSEGYRDCHMPRYRLFGALRRCKKYNKSLYK